MANELTISVQLSYTKNGITKTWTENATSVSVSGDAVLDNIQSVGTSEEAILLGDVAAGGWLMAQNLDSTNFVELRSGTGATDIIRLKANDPPVLMRLSGDASAPYAIADTAACNVRFLIFPA